MVDQHDGVAVRQKVVHDAEQALHVGGVEPDRRLVQHVEHARRPVADGAGELDALALAGGERRARAIEREVSQPQLLKAAYGLVGLGADRVGHLAQLVRNEQRHPGNPGRKLVERHRRGIREVHAIDLGCARRGREARAATVRAHVLAEEPGHAREALLVLGLGERVLHRVDRIEVGEVQLGEALAILGLVEDVLLDGRAVEDDVALLGRELAERHVGAHAHRAADLLHEVPHETAPGQHRAVVDRDGLVRHERGLVDRAHHARALAGGAGAAAVERQVLGAGPRKLAPHSGQVMGWSVATAVEGGA